MKLDFILNFDIVVVGSGIAGLVSTKEAVKTGKNICLITNGNFGGGASYFPLKGTLGIQSTLNNEDREKFLEDIKNIGNKMENEDLIKTYINEIPDNISSLKEIGFEPWLRNDRRPACFAKYPRDIYLIKDWEKAREKGKEIFSNFENLKIFENTSIVKIIKDNEKIIGGIFKNKDKFFGISSPIIILATGGIAGNFKHKLYPEDVNGIGHIVALDSGAEVQNMEFIQFIPGFLKPKYNTLFGEHTLKYCEGMFDLNNNLIFDGINNPENKNLWIERSGYAPFSFDFESHKIDLKMINSLDNEGVILKYSKDLYKDEGEFYKVYLSWLKDTMGIDMCKDEVIITPFVHSCNGGIKINNNSETSVKGLYAVGEISSCIEGANRLGGNSVGGSLVFGKRAIISAINYLKNSDFKEYSLLDFQLKFNDWLDSLIDGKNILSENEILTKLKAITSKACNIKRNEKVLNISLKEIENLKNNFSIKENIKSKGLEIYLRLEVTKMLILSMLERKESRGAHYREDYPYSLDDTYKIILSRKNNNFIVKILKI
ncbi:MAG: FAD-binding protein [Fusobacterium perfoetens]|uniref:FAD-binding protein n=1 Tax=Fusobacterium perfoetens TaxID=852 RepID=UPI0023F2CE42|nr:FAD-binding protein [Fusobacterium perfoetens]MCI6152709.1 FAD-binding protein [Fusobacterium perfoetens]MDY3236603.1 FAD-binding protein [Fusobacterium perfoetens]